MNYYLPKIELSKALNPEQEKAARHFSGPALIIAGPGTGKTRVLTYRIINLIQNKAVPAENILAVTFTNKAANEIKERLKVLFNNNSLSAYIKISTFHALGFSILKEHPERFGRNKHFSILDEADKKRILRQNIGIDNKKINEICQAITKCKQNVQSIEEIENKGEAKIFSRYEMILRQQNSFDLEDLIYHPVRLFILYPEILNFYRNRFKWIMIDEYQDINFAQYQLLICLMPDENANLCAIGDPNQAIYAFRGADVKFIKNFKNDYPGISIYRLKKSYRCSEHILKASSGVIQSGSSQVCRLEGLQTGIKIKLVQNSSDKSEAEFVARTVEKMIGGLSFFSLDSQVTDGDQNVEIKSLSDFAVLCRINSQIKVMQKAFHNHNIPYQVIEEAPFLKRQPISSIVDLLRISVNPKNDFLKDKLIDKKIISPSKFAQISDIAKYKSVRTAIGAIIDNYFSAQKTSKQKTADQALFDNLLDLADDYGDDLEGFLKFAALGSGVDTYKPHTENVTLMSLHAAKGLEFKCVFIIGCEDGLLPYSLFANQKCAFEDEKRLFYVGMTRAKRFLFLCQAKKRFIFGKEYRLSRSPYLNRIEEELVERSKIEPKKRKNKKDKQLSFF